MVQRLFGVIRDSLKMREMTYDPEKTVDLYYQISSGFIDSPDLRVTWLENLSEYEKKNYFIFYFLLYLLFLVLFFFNFCLWNFF
jgi:hypothetical protein